MKLQKAISSILVAFLLGFGTPLMATDVFFHINKPLYVEGENLFFKLYSPEHLSNNAEIQILISLYSPDGEHIIDKPISKIFQKGVVYGKFKLSHIEMDGNYHLRAFFNNKVYSIKIPIYRQELPENYVFEESETLSEAEDFQSTKVTISSDQANYSAREPVLIKISDSDPSDYLEPFNFSVSVFRQIQGESKTLLAANEEDYPLTIISELSGKVRLLSDNQLLPNSMIVAYFLNSETFTSSYTDKEGNIKINLDAVDQSDIMYMQAFTPQGARLGEVSLAKNEEQVTPIIKETRETKVERTPEINNYIYQSLQILEMEKMRSPSLSTTKKPVGIHRGIEFNSEINPNNFDQLVSFRDAVREIIHFAKIKKKKSTGNEIILLRSRADNIRYTNSPIYFINGVPLLNTQIIMDLTLSDIESIKVMNDPKLNGQFWQMGLFGVISITLKQGVENPYSTTLPTFTPVEGNFETVDFDKTIPSSGPYFTNELLWSSILYTDKTDSLKIKYSDDYSPFIIDVVGMTRTGNIEYSRKIIGRK